MDPRLLRGGFRIGFTIVAVALVTLPFQPRDSAEFVVTVLAALVGGAFVTGRPPAHPRGEPTAPK